MAIRKKFIDVEVPLLGETLRVLGTPEQLHKKTIKLDLTRKLRGKGLEIIFIIFNNNEKLTAYPKKMHLLKSHIRRMLRKRISYVEDSIKRECKDTRTIIKPLLITRKRVSRAVRKNLRNTVNEFLTDYLKDKEFLEICENILEGNLQKEMLPRLKKIYPLSLCEIRSFETKEPEKIKIQKPKEKPVEEIKQEEPAKEEVKEEEIKDTPKEKKPKEKPKSKGKTQEKKPAKKPTAKSASKTKPKTKKK